ncbi:GspH/FimT family pseudopilin [Caulobacter sp. 602-2]|uniref:GspH/FimT family pseudopilin n=1 Tax=Caulobacter sp. 602-2 TaxID=2710887 RepID=UPI001F0D8B14|nr:GspH/FimT family pseudopilin [Caulobacter sp. 602-2]
MATGADIQRPPGRQRREGFTLVELMIVLVIMGLLAGAVVLALPDGRLSLPQEAERFAAALLRARDEAVFRGGQVRVVAAGGVYRFERRAGRDWRPLDEAPFRARPFEDGTQFTAAPDATVVFDPTGLANPTEFTFARGQARRTVVVDLAGNVSLDAPRPF